MAYPTYNTPTSISTSIHDIVGTGSPETWNSDVRVESTSFMNAVEEAPSLTQQQQIKFRTFGQGTTRTGLIYDVDAGVASGFKSSQNYLIVADAAMTYTPNESTALTVGRKTQHWSALDEAWSTTLWQPTYAPDPLRPEQLGLTGFFGQWKGSGIKVTAFASPFFIPDITPDIRTEDGHLLIDNRWRRQRTEDFDFSGHNNRMYYNIKVPETSKIVSQASGALNVELGSRNDGAWVSGSIARKPNNELLITRQNYKLVDQDRVNVELSAQVGSHEVRSLDLGYTAAYAGVVLSALQDTPDFTTAEERDTVIQKLSAINAYGAHLEVKPMPFRFPTLTTSLNYLRVFGGEIEDVMENGARDDRQLFDSRIMYRNALSFDVQGELARIARRPLISKFKYLYDWEQRGILISTEFQFFPTNNWGVLVGADMLGVEDENYKPTAFLNQFRANDRFYGGLTYVF